MRIIDMRDLNTYIAKNWKGLLISCVLFVAIILGVGCVNKYCVGNTVPSRMTEKLDTIAKVTEEYNAAMESRVRKMNANHYEMGRVTFTFDKSMKESYELALSNCKKTDFFQTVADLVDSDLKYYDIRCLVYVWGDTTDDGSYRILFDFKSDSHKDVEQVMNAISDVFYDQYEGLTDDEQADLPVEKQTVYDNPQIGDKSYLKSSKESFEKYIQELEQKKKDLVEELTSNELKYYKVYYLNEQVTPSQKEIAKLIVEGVTVGLVAGLVLYAIMYIINQKIKSAKEIRSGYGLPVIAIIDKTEVGIDVSKKISRARQYRKHGQLSDVSYLEKALATIYQTPVCVDFSKDKVFFEYLSSKVGNIPILDFAQKSAESLAALSETHEAIVVVSLYSTKYRELERELEVYRTAGIKLRGVVVLA